MPTNCILIYNKLTQLEMVSQRDRLSQEFVINQLIYNKQQGAPTIHSSSQINHSNQQLAIARLPNTPLVFKPYHQLGFVCTLNKISQI